MTHDFNDDLAYSHSQSDAPWWETVYRNAFPDMVEMVDLRDDGWHQRACRDRAIVLSTGRTLYVDEKVRKRAWGDIALEVWSLYPKHVTAPPYRDVAGAVPGWARKIVDCDYVAYAFEPSRTCYLLPFFSVRTAVLKHGEMLQAKATAEEDGYHWVVAENSSYNTISIAVPLHAIGVLLQYAMTIGWKREDVA